jgi:pyrroloquinoline quinone (PQQ) biosynthesis protein C
MDPIFFHSICCKGVQWINSPHNGQSIEEVCNQMENERGKGRNKENGYHDKMIYKWFSTVRYIRPLLVDSPTRLH